LYDDYGEESWAD
jgi:hypothetical protein